MPCCDSTFPCFCQRCSLGSLHRLCTLPAGTVRQPVVLGRPAAARAGQRLHWPPQMPFPSTLEKAFRFHGLARQERKCRRQNVCGQTAVHRQHGRHDPVFSGQAAVENSCICPADLFLSGMGFCLLRGLLGVQRLVPLLSAQKRLSLATHGRIKACIRYTNLAHYWR